MLILDKFVHYYNKKEFEMSSFEKRRKKIFSDDVISEMVREISEGILLKNEFGMTFFSLFQKVSKKIFQKTGGYVLSNGHFILSILKSSGPEMMMTHDPFVSNYTFSEHKIHHQDNLNKINNIVNYIYEQSRKVA